MAEKDDEKSGAPGTTDVDESKAQDEAAATGTESIQTDDKGKAQDTQEDSFEEPDWWEPGKKRYTQFKGESLKEYFEQLEKAYAHSYGKYKEVKEDRDKLRGEKLSEIATGGTGPDTGEKATDQAQPASVTDAWVASEMKRRHVDQFQQFADKHPEVNEDDDLFDKLDKETGKYMDYVFKTEQRVPELSESLEFAWHRVKPEDSKDEKIASAVKNAGSGSKSTGVSKDSPKRLFSDRAIAAARKIDPSLRDKSLTEIETILAKYKQ